MSPRGRSFGVIGLPARFWLMRSTSAVSYWSSNLSGSKWPALLVDDVPGEIEHVLGDFDVLDLVEILVFGSDFVGVAQQRPHQPLVERLERDDVLTVGQHHATDRDLVHLADGFADHREGVVADLAVGSQVVGTDQIARIDLASVDELVDLDGARRFQRDVLELLLGHLDEGVGVERVALDDVLVGDLLAGVGVDLQRT